MLSEHHFARNRTSPLVTELSAKPALQEPLFRELVALSKPWLFVLCVHSNSSSLRTGPATRGPLKASQLYTEVKGEATHQQTKSPREGKRQHDILNISQKNTRPTHAGFHVQAVLFELQSGAVTVDEEGFWLRVTFLISFT